MIQRIVAIITGVLFSFQVSAAAVSSVASETFSAAVYFSDPVPTDTITLEAKHILRCQVANDRFGSDDKGCINDIPYGEDTGPTWVVPRENGTAILGLVEAWLGTMDGRYRTGALLAADYLKNRQEEDGSWCTQYNEFLDTIEKDSYRQKSPSTAGSALMALYKIKSMGWEDETHSYYETAKKAAEFLRMCVDNKPGAKNGLCGSGKEYAFPGNHDAVGDYRWSDWSWVSDNCYAYLGLMCFRDWAEEKGEIELSAACNAYAENILDGISRYLKNPHNAVWYRVVGGNGELVSESEKIDALCYYPQKYDLPVPEYGREDIAAWMSANLQVKTGSVSQGYGAFVWGDAAGPEESDRRSPGFSMEAWLALHDIGGSPAASVKMLAERWWEAEDNTNGCGRLWNTTYGGFIDWFDPDGRPSGEKPNASERFIDTSAYAIFVYRSGYNFNPTEIRQTGATISVAGGTVVFPNAYPGNGSTQVVIPTGALGKPVAITIEKLLSGDSSFGVARSPSRCPQPLEVYRFGPEGLTFNKMVTLSLLYKDLDQNGIIDGTSFKEDDLRIMWWDNFEWRIVGGKVNKKDNVVTADIRHFSVYAVFPVDEISSNDFRPKEKIITPATRGANDYATFGNLNLAAGDVVNIYDITGRRIRNIRDVNTWDGRNDNNEIVESGLYIYQIKTAAGEVISGTIIVAK